eukprot:scaffold24754_cov135-Isochrysis_galbana.AAC.5
MLHHELERVDHLGRTAPVCVVARQPELILPNVAWHIVATNDKKMAVSGMVERAREPLGAD